mmetsp:Transcript_25002/g.56630  ORF Transcript_25002/g.56630 Transcript_25002/m.56630 type:complete len:310 (-) Transcript_25002:8-937(-)
MAPLTSSVPEMTPRLSFREGLPRGKPTAATSRPSVRGSALTCKACIVPLCSLKASQKRRGSVSCTTAMSKSSQITGTKASKKRCPMPGSCTCTVDASRTTWALVTKTGSALASPSPRATAKPEPTNSESRGRWKGWNQSTLATMDWIRITVKPRPSKRAPRFPKPLPRGNCGAGVGAASTGGGVGDDSTKEAMGRSRPFPMAAPAEPLPAAVTARLVVLPEPSQRCLCCSSDNPGLVVDHEGGQLAAAAAATAAALSAKAAASKSRRAWRAALGRFRRTMAGTAAVARRAPHVPSGKLSGECLPEEKRD